MRAVLVASAMLLVAAGCDTWTHYRGGPSLAGVGSESAIGLANVGSLTETWRGSGPASSPFDAPVVSGGRVYTTQAVYDVAGGGACSGSPRSCSPAWLLSASTSRAPSTVAGGRQYRLPSYPDGSLAAFDAAGVDGCTGTPKVCQPVRRWSAPAWAGTTFAGGLASPVVVGSTVYAGNTMVAAADVSSDAGCTGTPPQCPLTWMAPDLWPLNALAVVGGRVYSVGNLSSPVAPGKLQVLDAAGVEGCGGGVPKTCQPIWTGDLGPGSGPQAAAMPPTVVEGRVYAMASWQTTTGVIDTWTASSVLRVFDAAGVDGCTGSPAVCQPLWSAPLPGNGRMWTGAAVTGGRVYVPVDAGVLVFDAKGVQGCGGTPTTCSPIATLAYGSSPGGYSAATVANGVLYVGSNDGLFAFDAGLVQGCSGAPLVCQPVLHVLGGTSVTTPAVVDGRVHVLSNGQLVTLGLP